MTDILPGTMISSLPVAISLDGSEYVPIVQGGTTKRTSVSAIATNGSQVAGTTIFITAAGSTTIGDSVGNVIINKTVATPTTLLLGSVTARSGLALHVTDATGLGGDIIFVASGIETFMGFTGNWVIGSGGVPGSGGFVTFNPSITLNGWYL